MRDPESTKIKILEAASALFNKQGYKATSISDITSASGLTKGAIYKHFRDKAELEKVSLVTMVNKVIMDLSSRIKKGEHAREKLLSILDYFEGYIEQPPFAGGCPLMNAAIEVDDTDIKLKKVVAEIMLSIQNGIAIVIQNGIDREQIDDKINADDYASLLYSSVEGGIMMMKVTDNPAHLRGVVAYLRKDIIEKTK